MRYFIITTITLLLSSSGNAQKYVGIGTNNPLALLHVVDSNVLFSATGPTVLTPGNVPVEGEGRRMMWYADKSAFRVGYVSNNIYWNKDSIGNYSFASGYNTQASGLYSTAMGLLSLASGENSVSIGYNTEASGSNSVAIGYGNKATGFGSFGLGFSGTASGRFSTTIGVGNTAAAREGFSMGSYNDASDVPNPNTAAATDRIFQIGNGTNFGNRKNALTILRNGNVGIGILAPAARLQVADSSVVFTSGNGGVSKPPVEGPGGRMMWYADKSALRAGAAASNEWDKDSIGATSFAAGYAVKAKGLNSIALGRFAEATADFSCAFGINTSARGSGSISFAGALANGYNSFSVGDGSITNGNISIAMGTAAVTNGGNAIALGHNVTATAIRSFVVGEYNETATDPSSTNFVLGTDRLFQLGNGNGNTRSNALTILRNGNMGVGVLAPQYILDVNGRPRLRYTPGLTAGIWYNNSSNIATAFAGMNTDTQWGIYGSGWKFLFDVNNGEAYKASGSTSWIIASDARLKENVHPYTDGINEIMKINPVWFNYTKESGLSTVKPYVGVIAQELQKTAPYMVGTFEKNGEELLNVDNSSMIYMLINAVKELSKRVEELEKSKN
ncbi:tail fiber domain-containing protein [Ferruginibacter sp. SUN002]|uniref:tail fiber domain-containing protein n=1 Tax=Ferruginibacter sp. SUN002 TaxID=2937789 RepID=UPI003D35ECDD